MYKKMKDELTMENITMLDRMKAMGINLWPGTDRTVEDFMLEVERNSQENLRKKFGYGQNENKPNQKDIKSYYFITINLEGEKNELLNLYDRLQEAIYRYKWLRNSIINYEYYTKNGGHPHSHIVLITDKRRDTILQLLSIFFKIKKNFIDIKRYYADPKNHINYIKGIKKDPEKDEYIKNDESLREELNIPPFTDMLVANLE